MPHAVAYRCAHCGNRTRFDVYERISRRRFHHYTLGGALTVDDEHVIEAEVERVVCRWCDRADTVEVFDPGPG